MRPLLAHLTTLCLLCLAGIVRGKVPSSECFTCMSNPNWDFYASRIQGLKAIPPSQQPTLAPISCIFTPLRVYSDRTAVSCPGKCFKWIVHTIRADGGVEASILRGCFEKLIDVAVHAPPKDSRCYQSPADYNHQVDVEYTTGCFCTGFLCNSAVSGWPYLPALALAALALR